MTLPPSPGPKGKKSRDLSSFPSSPMDTDSRSIFKVATTEEENTFFFPRIPHDKERESKVLLLSFYSSPAHINPNLIFRDRIHYRCLHPPTFCFVFLLGDQECTHSFSRGYLFQVDSVRSCVDPVPIPRRNKEPLPSSFFGSSYLSILFSFFSPKPTYW